MEVLMKKKYLYDSFDVEGSFKENLQNHLSEIGSITQKVTLSYDNVILYSVERHTKNGVFLLRIDPAYMNARGLIAIKKDVTYYSPENKNYFFVEYKKLKSLGFDDRLIADMLDKRYFLKVNEQIIIPGKTFTQSLQKKLGMTGIKSIDDPIIVMFLGYLIMELEDDIQIVGRGSRRIMKGMSCYSMKYRVANHDTLVHYLFDAIFDRNDNSSMSYFHINMSKTEVRIEFFDQTYMCKWKVGDKYIRNRICPSLVFITSHTSEYATSIQGYISVGGTGMYVGNPVTITDLTQEGVTAAVDMFFKQEYDNLISMSKKLGELADEKEYGEDVYKKVMNKSGLSSALGGIYSVIKNDICGTSFSKKDIFFIILQQVKALNTTRLELGNEVCPESAIYRVEKCFGTIFTNKDCKEIFGW